MRTMSPGAWYLLYTCEACHRKQVLFPDLSNGQAQFMGTYGVHCPQCKHHGFYDGEKLERYQHPPELTVSA